MQTVEKIIIEAGLRPTKARLAVLKTIAEAGSALSHAEIVEHLAGQKEFDRVTIYRVLDWLTEHQLIHKISGENRAWKFQLNVPSFSKNSRPGNISTLFNNSHHHAHLHCTACGKISCIHTIRPHFPQATLDEYQVTAIDINLKGICADCRSK